MTTPCLQTWLVCWRHPFLLILGGAPGRPHCETSADAARCRFGRLFDLTIQPPGAENARRTSWPTPGGVGWRTSLVSGGGLIGGAISVLRLSLRKPYRTTRVIPCIRLTDLHISVEQRDALCAALQTGLRVPVLMA